MRRVARVLACALLIGCGGIAVVDQDSPRDASGDAASASSVGSGGTMPGGPAGSGGTQDAGTDPCAEGVPGIFTCCDGVPCRGWCDPNLGCMCAAIKGGCPEALVCCNWSCTSEAACGG
jgi:hypothetical protein